MSELSSALGGSAPKHAVVCGGRSYPVSLVTQNAKLAYEKALFEKARAAVAAVKGVADPGHYERKIDALVEKYEAGFFALEGEFSRAAMARPGGTLLLLSVLMGKYVPDGAGGVACVPLPEVELLNLAAEAPDEVAAVLKAVLKESFPAVKFEAEDAAGPKA